MSNELAERLPDLPEPWQCETRMCPNLYTADQMREYAARAIREAGSKHVAWYVFAETEHWVTLDREEADEHREDGCQVRPLVFAPTPDQERTP